MCLQPTDAKPGPAFIKRFCGFHKPGEMPSGLYSGPFLDSQQTERPTTLTTFAALRFAPMGLAARPSRSPSPYDRLRFGCTTQLGRRGEQGLSLPLRGACWIRPPFSPQPTPVPDCMSAPSYFRGARRRQVYAQDIAFNRRPIDLDQSGAKSGVSGEVEKYTSPFNRGNRLL